MTVACMSLYTQPIWSSKTGTKKHKGMNFPPLITSELFLIPLLSFQTNGLVFFVSTVGVIRVCGTTEFEANLSWNAEFWQFFDGTAE